MAQSLSDSPTSCRKNVSACSDWWPTVTHTCTIVSSTSANPAGCLETNDVREHEQNNQSDSASYIEWAVTDQWGTGEGYKGVPQSYNKWVCFCFYLTLRSVSASPLTPRMCVVDSTPSYPLSSRTIPSSNSSPIMESLLSLARLLWRWIWIWKWLPWLMYYSPCAARGEHGRYRKQH